MKRYDTYKDSGVEWIGEIPENWEVRPIKRLCSVKRGASPRPIDDEKYFDDNGEYSWVRIADVTASDKYLQQTTQKLSELGASLSVKMEPDNIFLSIAGSVGKPIINKIKCCIHDGFVWFDGLQLNPEFLFYIFLTGEPYKGLGKYGTQLNLNTETVGSIKIPFPAENEILKVVDYLNKKYSEIDHIIKQKELLLEKLQAKRQAIIHEAVSKGLNPNVPMKPSGVEWLGEIPSHWEVKKLKYLATLKSGESITAEQIEPEGSFPVFGGNGIRGYTNSFTHNGTYILIGRQGALCGNINYAENKFWASEHAVVVTPKEKLNQFWLGELLRSMNLNQYSQSAAQPGLAVGNIINLNIPVPKVEEQAEIDLYIKERDTKIKRLEKLLFKQIQKLKSYRQSLISEVVTGKIKVV